MNKVNLETIASLCKRRGFIYQGSEIYGGLAGTWDYGPLGTQLKRNIENLWIQHFVDEQDNMYLLDSTVLMNPKVWDASGHVETFTDPLVECSNCHMRFRADKIDTSKCPNCGKEHTFGEPIQFNTMFKTSVGAVQDENAYTYLRPETAQGMFVDFKNVVDSFYPDIPFGLAQVGRVFRNEISPRDYLFRVREFEIMEFEYFIEEKDWEKHFEKLRKDMEAWFNLLGLSKDKIKEVEVPEKDRAHYSKRTIDYYYDFPSVGFDEIAGLAYRGDFDLKNHQEASGKNLEYRPKDGGDPFLPHVIEPSLGLDRNFLAVVSEFYREDKVNDEDRTYLAFPYHLAPVKLAVFPLLKNKPELVAKAKEIYKKLKKEYGAVMWDDNGNIGKRYRRQDEIGTPFCVTVDFQTLEDDTFTLRERDTTDQKRVDIKGLEAKIKEIKH
jgi:glycyl-tRNA synthetase